MKVFVMTCASLNDSSNISCELFASFDEAVEFVLREYEHDFKEYGDGNEERHKEKMEMVEFSLRKFNGYTDEAEDNCYTIMEAELPRQIECHFNKN